MDAPFLATSLAVLTTLSLLALPLSAASHDILPLKSSLIVEDYKTNSLQSSDGTFSCGFYNIYTNAFTFSIWYSNSVDKAIVWSANRGRPVHSRRSAITLRKDGSIVLSDYDGTVVWQTDGKFPNVQYVQLLNTVPGHYSFRFSDQSILSLIYDDTNVSGIYWPDPDYMYYENNRNLYNSTRIGSLDDYGDFFASDLANSKALVASDRGFRIKRRLTLDYDDIITGSMLVMDYGIVVVFLAELAPSQPERYIDNMDTRHVVRVNSQLYVLSKSDLDINIAARRRPFLSYLIITPHGCVYRNL
uniref:non-specific serine/threonine protein kinase n=1 Tax=Oryza brachyantha TaxID=4533 RepID=J3N5S9_ORYBR